MQLVDANVLLYAVNRASPNHERSRTWLDSALTGHEAVGFAWVVLLAFLRLSTHPAVFARPLDARQATDLVRAWLGQPAAIVAEPTARHAEVLAGLLTEAGSAGNLVNDAHLAALAIEHGAMITTFDADFGRFPGVGWSRPDGDR
jgi:toxin-antitoxin system PIN domain toxin